MYSKDCCYSSVFGFRVKDKCYPDTSLGRSQARWSLQRDGFSNKEAEEFLQILKDEYKEDRKRR